MNRRRAAGMEDARSVRAGDVSDCRFLQLAGHGTGLGVGPDGGDRLPRRGGGKSLKRLAVVMVLCVAAPLLGGCGSDDDQSLPPVDDPPTSPNSPSTSDGGTPPATNEPANESNPPKGADLKPGEQAAYEKAIEDYAEWKRIQDRLWGDPRRYTPGRSRSWVPNDKTLLLIRDHTYKPYSVQTTNSFRRIARAGAHTEGQIKTVWQVQVEVDLKAEPRPVVVFKECIDTVDNKVMHGNTEIPQGKDLRFQIRRVTSYADDNGDWRTSRVKSRSKGVTSC